MAIHKIVVIANKKWEAAPILGVFRAPYAVGSFASSRPAEWKSGMPYPVPQPWPDQAGQHDFAFRYTLQFGDARAECWCLADFEDTSDSGKKSAYIPLTIASGAPDLVIAVGTAAAMAPLPQGSVVAGTRAFMHDPQTRPAPAQPSWPAPMLDTMMESTFAKSLAAVIAGLPTAWPINVRSRLLRPPSGRQTPELLMDASCIAVGDVNADAAKYKITDPLCVDACKKVDPEARVGSIETTSALIRAKTDPAPFMFISGIANSLGFFNRDIADNEYAQNFAASHNAGVLLAWLLPALLA
ncbi:MAG: hypothetical protein M3Y50_12250 [Acidobacteriota bacterium]|nr:hypothetical protein [Acidobacteriota bacterium]